jgi:hypothetical protein
VKTISKKHFFIQDSSKVISYLQDPVWVEVTKITPQTPVILFRIAAEGFMLCRDAGGSRVKFY